MPGISRRKVRFITGIAFGCFAFVGCWRPLSRSDRSQIAETIVRARLDWMYTRYAPLETWPPVVQGMMYRRVILLSGSKGAEEVAQRIRGSLKGGFVAIRTELTEIETRIDTVRAENGTLQEIHDTRDIATGLPVYVMEVVSVRGRGLFNATAVFQEADTGSADAQGSRWFLTKESGEWRADSSYVTWIT